MEVAVSAVMLLASAVGLIAHFRAPGQGWMLGVSAFSPYLMLGAPLSLVLLLVAREWPGAALALVLTAAALWTQQALWTSSTPPKDGVHLVIMTANLKLGGATPSSIVAAVRRNNVDILMVQELTSTEQSRLIAAGLQETLPNSVTEPRPEAMGTGLWTRLAMPVATKRTDLAWGFVTAEVIVPGVAGQATIAALHVPGPIPDSILWHHDIRKLQEILPGLGGGAGAAIVGGDFNATVDLHQFRELLSHGYADAAEQAGSGATPTFPSNSRFIPPMIAIDHVLTRGAVATNAYTVTISGSDHRALIVDVAVPRMSLP